MANHLRFVKCLSLLPEDLFETRKREFGSLTTMLCREIIDFAVVETENELFQPYSFVNVPNWVKVQG